jgi:hypothetical protein
MTTKEAAADTTNAIGHAHCYGTIYGVSQMLILLQHSQHPDPIVCTTVPPSATPEQRPSCALWELLTLKMRQVLAVAPIV